MEDIVRIEVVPAAVLKRVRDRGPISGFALAQSFGIVLETTEGSHVRAAETLQACLSRLSRAGLIEPIAHASSASESDRAPLSDDVSWIATAQLPEIQGALHLSLTELEDTQLQSCLGEVRRIRSLPTRLDPALLNRCFRADLLASLKELALCLERRCYIAVMALSGKILEICIKHELESQGQPVDDSWMLGALLGRLKVSGVAYVDPALNNIANIINVSRIPAIHAKLNIPVPSEDQAAMVVRAVCDVLERTLLAPSRQGSNAP